MPLCNTDRRHLSKLEIGMAFSRLKKIPREEGGARQKRGRPEKDGAKPTFSKSRDDAASLLGVGTDEARALEVIATTPGVPAELELPVGG